MFTRHTLLVLAWGALALVPMRSTDLPTQYLPIIGGTGGNGFTRRCGAGYVLTGLQYRSGLVIDAVGLLCRPIKADGSLGAESTVGSMVGGSGGTLQFARCGSRSVVRGAYIQFGSAVNSLNMSCLGWDTATRSMTERTSFVLAKGVAMATSAESTRCGEDTQPAVAIRGRSGLVIDAIGFICDEP